MSTRTETNLFTKNLLTTVTSNDLKEAFKSYGEIASIFVSPKTLESFVRFGFVNFKNKEDSEKALKSYSRTESVIFLGHNRRLKVNMVNNQQYQLFNDLERSESHLFLENLSAHVSENDLKKAFENFGEVTSAIIKPVQTNFGYIDFKDKEDCKKALAEAIRDDKILSLYYDRQMYLNYYMTKEQHKAFQEVVLRTKLRYKSPAFLPSMNFPPGMHPSFEPRMFPNYGPYMMPPHGGMQPFHPPHMPPPPPPPPHMQPPYHAPYHGVIL